MKWDTLISEYVSECEYTHTYTHISVDTHTHTKKKIISGNKINLHEDAPLNTLKHLWRKWAKIAQILINSF